MKCHNCYNDRTKKGSLIIGDVVFCNDGCFEKWQSENKVLTIYPVNWHIMELTDRRYLREENEGNVYWYEEWNGTWESNPNPDDCNMLEYLYQQ